MNKFSAIMACSALTTTALTAGAQLQGSDTLEGITNCIINTPGIGACPGIGSLTYAGGGSTTGENAMDNGTQHIAPMSRFLDNSACDPSCGGTAPCTQSEAECQAVAFDGLAITADEAVAAACPAARYTGTIAVTDQNGTAGVQCPGCNAGTSNYDLPTTVPERWRDVLRIIFAGLSKTGGGAIANKDCNSDLRHTLANNWGSFFEGGCAAGGCTVLEHAWRRSDLSGTTDTFLTLLGLPAIALVPFCNGYANHSAAQNGVQDLDPIRRRCNPGDDVCGPDGAPGTFNGPGTLGLVQAIFVPPGATATIYPTTPCSPGSFRYVNAPFNSSNRCPNGRPSTFLQCLTPRIAATGSFACLNTQTNIPTFGTPEFVDGRAYNLFPRNAAGDLLTDASIPPRQIEGAAYRFDTTCLEADATRQIGCLTGANPCTIGFAGREAVLPGLGASALEVNDESPFPDTQITSLTYPLSRRLYLCSIRGFENVAAQSPTEAALASCYLDEARLDVCIPQQGFVPVPPSGDDVCEDFNESICPGSPVNVNACL